MTAAGIRIAAGRLRNLAGVVRMPDWWEFKLSPILAIFWGVALGCGRPLLPLASTAAVLLVAVAACAVFVSVLNDVTDLEVDRIAGKPNRMRGHSVLARAALLGIPALIGLGIATMWRGHPALAAVYLGSFLAFILYSVPPVRFKGRAALGVAADAAGAHLFPTLTATLLAFAAMNLPADRLLIGAACAWSFALGVRGILWHQLGDVAADARTGVRTLPRAVAPATIVRLGERVVFPIEVAALAILLWTMQAALACLFLALHLAVLMSRWRRNGIVPAIVTPRPRVAIALHEYYAMWLPVALILQSAVRHPADLILLLLHLMLFPARARQVAGEIWRLGRATRLAA
jgi:hypothetical protein